MTKFRTIVADPPWPYADGPTPRQREKGATSFLPYGTMTLAEIKHAVDGVDAAIDAHLYLWTTQRFLWDAYDIAQASSFMPQQVLVWCKPPNGVGMGGAFAPTVEFVLFCRRDWGVALDLARQERRLTVADVHRQIRGGDPTGLVQMWMNGQRYPNEEDWAKLDALLGPFGDRAGLPNPTDSAWWQWPRTEHSAKPEAFIDMVEQASPGPRLEMWARRARFGWDYWGDQSLGTAEVAA